MGGGPLRCSIENLWMASRSDLEGKALAER